MNRREALAMLAGEHAPLRPAVADFLRSFPAAVAPEMTPDIVWHAWADDLPEERAAISQIGEFVRQHLSR